MTGDGTSERLNENLRQIAQLWRENLGKCWSWLINWIKIRNQEIVVRKVEVYHSTSSLITWYISSFIICPLLAYLNPAFHIIASPTDCSRNVFYYKFIYSATPLYRGLCRSNCFWGRRGSIGTPHSAQGSPKYRISWISFKTLLRANTTSMTNNYSTSIKVPNTGSRIGVVCKGFYMLASRACNDQRDQFCSQHLSGLGGFGISFFDLTVSIPGILSFGTAAASSSPVETGTCTAIILIWHSWCEFLTHAFHDEAWKILRFYSQRVEAYTRCLFSSRVI